jgi:cytochrome c biogenesis protein CcdA
MAHVFVIVAAIAFVDSLNPSTVGPALVLAATDPSGARVRQFTLGVFAVFFAGGALLVLGPGQLLLAAVPRPDSLTKHIVEVTGGAVLLLVSLSVWMKRRRLAQMPLPGQDAGRRGALALGATISVFELPTAFPYFAAIAAIVDSDSGVVRQTIYLLTFNVVFILPLLVIAGALMLSGERAKPALERIKAWFERRWPTVTALVVALAGALLVIFGLVGFAT